MERFDVLFPTLMMTIFIKTTVMMFLSLLGLLFKVLYVIFCVVNSDNRLSTGFKLKIM